MRIAVYTITKNEEQFISRWVESAKQADVVLIADTGSTDSTVQVAQKLGASVVSVNISPWRFDDARNAALAALPLDVDLCIALDADEVLVEGWREHLERLPGYVTRPRYKYVWSRNPDGTEGLVYGGDKIHSRHGYRWKHPVHEVLVSSLGFEEKQEWCDLEIHHFPDHNKSRGQYSNLLEWATKEDPSDDRNAFYLGREYTYMGRFEDAGRELQRYLSLPNALWGPERSAAKRLLAKCYPENAEQWLLEASKEAPDRREPWVDLAQLYYSRGRWEECYTVASQALLITQKPLEYICDAYAWGALPYDLAAIAAYHLGKEECLTLGLSALNIEPEDKRLANNVEFYRRKKKELFFNPVLSVV
jgi:tetratricopeptide (TPR) repeat protein